MAQKLDREPTPKELATHADMGLRRVRNALDVRQLRNRTLEKMRDAYGGLLLQICSN